MVEIEYNTSALVLRVHIGVTTNIDKSFWIFFLQLSKPQPNLNTTVGFDRKMTLQTPPTHHHTNFSGTSRRARELKFGTDTH